MITFKQLMAVKEAVGSNGSPRGYQIKVKEGRGVYTITNRGEVVATINAKREVQANSADAEKVIAAIVEYWGD